MGPEQPQIATSTPRYCASSTSRCRPTRRGETKPKFLAGGLHTASRHQKWVIRGGLKRRQVVLAAGKAGEAWVEYLSSMTHVDGARLAWRSDTRRRPVCVSYPLWRCWSYTTIRTADADLRPWSRSNCAPSLLKCWQFGIRTDDTFLYSQKQKTRSIHMLAGLSNVKDSFNKCFLAETVGLVSREFLIGAPSVPKLSL
jgi:hypothetical protein